MYVYIYIHRPVTTIRQRNADCGRLLLVVTIRRYGTFQGAGVRVDGADRDVESLHQPWPSPGRQTNWSSHFGKPAKLLAFPDTRAITHSISLARCHPSVHYPHCTPPPRVSVSPLARCHSSVIDDLRFGLDNGRHSGDSCNAYIYRAYKRKIICCDHARDIEKRNQIVYK